MGVLSFDSGYISGKRAMVSWKFGNGMDQENGNGSRGTAMEMDFELFTR